jgi:uncharacterized protein
MTTSTKSMVPTTLGTVHHVAPAITDDSAAYWTGGSVGELRIYRCDDCGNYIHPPVPVCRKCRSIHVRARAVSGKGTLVSFTVNHQPWSQMYDGPYIVGLVAIQEQAGINLMTNIVGCSLEEVQIGMRLDVVFRQLGDAWLPLFRPAR